MNRKHVTVDSSVHTNGAEVYAVRQQIGGLTFDQARVIQQAMDAAVVELISAVALEAGQSVRIIAEPVVVN